jgi:sulfite reductase alpha subunit-like flavoprotein
LDYCRVDGAFLPWSSNLQQRLLEEYPLPEGTEPIPDGVLLDPKWLLDFMEEFHQPSNHDRPTSPSSSIANDYASKVPPQDLIDVPSRITANVVSNTRLTPEKHWQDVRHLTLNLVGGHQYMPGDVVTIYPKNFPSDVSQFIRIMGWTSIADRSLKFVPCSPSATRLPIPNITTDTSITLRSLLTNHLDLMSIPRRSFFAHLAHFTNDPFQRDRLLEFTNPEYIDELYDYTTRPRRSILEVLQEFESVKIPWQRVCSVIPALRGRQFSIASAMEPGATDEQTRVELLIAIVKYRTVIKKIREGVCTRYISSLNPGQDITVTLQKGSLGVNRSMLGKPVVMIGPGTGVAPMRALIHQRKHWRDGAQNTMAKREGSPKDVLFFGCRNAESDFFFRDEWEELKKDALDVFAAFSRDQVQIHRTRLVSLSLTFTDSVQRQKVYVQDLVRQHSARVYDALVKHAGIVYLCGSSGKMPQAVREALIEAFQTGGDMARETAEAYLVGLEKSGRYKQETW